MKVDKELKFLIEKFYKLKPTQIKKLKRGTINNSFLIITNLGRYILRIYKRNITETQIKPEHKILEFLHNKGFPVPCIIPANNGKTYVRKNGCIFALFEFIQGRHIKNPNLFQIKNSAQCLGKFHKYMKNFCKSKNFKEILKKDWWTPESINLERYYKQAVDLNPKYYILPFLKSQIGIFRENISKDMLKKLPHIIIHDDFSLENLLFKGDNIIGILDFDNVHFDIRILELITPLESIVGLGKRKIKTQHIKLFINEYEKSSNMPLSLIEKVSMIEIFRIKHLQEALWQVRQYLRYRRRVNLIALNKQINFLKWLDKNAQYLQQIFIST